MKIFESINKKEIVMWLTSVIVIISSFLMFDRNSLMTLLASLVGVTSLTFAAKGNPIGMVLMIIFSLIYGMISFSFRYYGETLTYVGMTLPMSVVSLVSWLKHPYKGKRSQVEVNKVSRSNIYIMFVLSLLVTFIFYFILMYFNTKNIFFSTVSITTSFIAAYLTALRSPYYALAYALNDIVLIVLWTFASFEDLKYISVTICFIAFLMWDLYGFCEWKQMYKNQNNA